MSDTTPRTGWIGDAIKAAIADLFHKVIGLLLTLEHFIEDWLTVRSKAQYGIAIGRIGLGLTGFGLLLANFHTRYYTFGSGVAWSGERIQPVSDFPKIWIFSAFYNVSMNDAALTTLYVLLMALALVFAAGWRMKVTLPLFGIFWVSFIEMTDFIGDQGDNIFRMALIALLFVDTSAKWSLDDRRRKKFAAQMGDHSYAWQLLHGGHLAPSWMRNTAQNLALVVITAQISFIYVSGALYKAGGLSWQGGTAIYSPLNVARFGTWPFLSHIVTHFDWVVAGLTYGALLTQCFFPLMLLNKWTRKLGIIGITGIHIGIGVLMGLPWFSLTMISLDMIFVSDSTWVAVSGWLRNAFRRPQPVAPEPEPEPAPEPVRKPAGRSDVKPTGARPAAKKTPARPGRQPVRSA
jgi:hypothetical protein